MSRRAWRAARIVPPLALAFASAFASVAGAAELQFSASVDRTTVGLGEPFQFVLTVQGEDMLSVPSPVLPPLPDVNVLGSSSSQSTNISIVNGQMKRQATVSFIYALAAKQLGKVTIAPCRLTYQGREYQTAPVEITVVKAPQAQAAPQPSSSSPGLPAQRSQLPVDGNLTLSVTPSRRSVYVGEPLLLDVSLLTRFQISNGGWAEVPAFEGFWVEKVFDAERFDFQRRTIDGKSFAVAPLKKSILFPLSPGVATIKPMSFNVSVAQAPRDFFDAFGTSQAVRIRSKPVTIQVLDLPERDRPAEFSGGVGQFDWAANLDRAATANGEPVNLVVRVSGTGNVRMIDKPRIETVAGLRILPPETKDESRVSGDVVRGSRTFRFPMIPQRDGRFTVPAIALAYFDPKARAYRTLHAGPFEFTATGSNVTASPVAEASGLRVLGSDIGYIKPDLRALDTAPLAPPFWPNLVYLLSLGVLGVAFGYRGHSERLASDRGYARKTRSSGLVRRRLKDAESRLRKHDEQGFHASLTQAVSGYVGDRFDIDSHAMTRDRLRAELEQRAVAPELAAELIAIIDQCEIARFSPGLLDAHDPRALFERTRDALGRI